MSEELECTCPDLINGHHSACPYAKRAERRGKQVQKQMLNNKTDEKWQEKGYLDEHAGGYGFEEFNEDMFLDHFIGRRRLH